jgi:hypothetical protein
MRPAGPGGLDAGGRDQRSCCIWCCTRLRSSDMSEQLTDLAYYYPEPYWGPGHADAMKNLLLFFDGIAILLPRYMSGRERAADPVLAAPLLEKGLLRVLEPETFVDQQVTEALITALTELVTGGAFDDLNRREYGYAELSRSRMGWNADIELSEMITEELITRGLALPSEDRVSVPLHPAVRRTFLVLLSQLARDAGRRVGLRLHPATVSYDAIDDLISVMSLEPSLSAGHVVTLDEETVGLDLSAVPLEDVLDFREHHGEAYRVYARHVREQVTQLGLLEPEERKARLYDRREELADLANDLRKTARQWWRNPLGSFAIGAAGAAWLTAGPLHDPVGGLLALAGTGLAVASAAGQQPATAYSYILDARRALGSRSGRALARPTPY